MEALLGLQLFRPYDDPQKKEEAFEYYRLAIRELRLWISIGCTAEERCTLQPIDITITMHFSKEPIGCQSDELSHVCCYKLLSDQILQSVQDRSFHLIESLAAHIFNVVANHIQAENSVIEVTVIKPNPPVMHVQKGVTFTYCKRISQKFS